MNRKSKILSTVTIAAVFLFGSLGTPAVRWLKDHQADAVKARALSTLASELSIVLPVAGLSR